MDINGYDIMGFINQRITGGPQFVGLSYHFVIYSMVKRWPLDHRTFVQFWDCSTLTTRMVWACNVRSLFEFKPFGPRDSIFLSSSQCLNDPTRATVWFLRTPPLYISRFDPIWYYLIRQLLFFESSADICGHTSSKILPIFQSCSYSMPK